MRVVLATAGSRGDQQPFVALGASLVSQGHEVHLFLDPAQGVPLAARAGLPCSALAPARPDTMGAIMKALVGGQQEEFWQGLGKWSGEAAQDAGPAMLEHARSFRPHAIVCSTLLRNVGLALGEAVGAPSVTIELQPQVATAAFPHHATDAWKDPSALCAVDNQTGAVSLAPPATPKAGEAPASHEETYESIDRLLWGGLQDGDREFRAAAGVGPGQDFDAWMRGRCGHREEHPVLHCYSAALCPRPGDYGDHAAVVGCLGASGLPDEAEGSGYVPPAVLADFLGAGGGAAPVVCFGWGSMPAPQGALKLARTAIAAARLAGVRAVIVGGAAGPCVALLESEGAGGDDPQGDAELVAWAREGNVVDAAGGVSHAWLLPQCAAGVCHGGAGTVHAHLAAGTPVVVTPVIADQFFWGKVAAAKGCGVLAPPLRALDAGSLAGALSEARAEGCREAARAVAARIAEEDAGAECGRRLAALVEAGRPAVGAGGGSHATQ